MDRSETSVPVFSWQMAEHLAVAHMNHLGFRDARVTGRGADGGLDALATDAAAQVKALAQPVGTPDIQRARGAAYGVKNLLFYSMAGYTPQAVTFADCAGVALFVYNAANRVAPANALAEHLVARSAIDQFEGQTPGERTIGVMEDLGEGTIKARQFATYLANHGAGNRGPLDPGLRSEVEALLMHVDAHASEVDTCMTQVVELMRSPELLLADPATEASFAGAVGELFVLRAQQRAFVSAWGNAYGHDVAAILGRDPATI